MFKNLNKLTRFENAHEGATRGIMRGFQTESGTEKVRGKTYLDTQESYRESRLTRRGHKSGLARDNAAEVECVCLELW